MMKNLWKTFIEWREWKRRDAEENFVGSARYITTFVDDDGNPTGEDADHIVCFFVDGNGWRYTRLDTGHKSSAEKHGAVRNDRHRWHYFAELPGHAERPNKSPKGTLVLIDGGAA